MKRKLPFVLGAAKSRSRSARSSVRGYGRRGVRFRASPGAGAARLRGCPCRPRRRWFDRWRRDCAVRWAGGVAWLGTAAAGVASFSSEWAGCVSWSFVYVVWSVPGAIGRARGEKGFAAGDRALSLGLSCRGPLVVASVCPVGSWAAGSRSSGVVCSRVVLAGRVCVVGIAGLALVVAAVSLSAPPRGLGGAVVCLVCARVSGWSWLSVASGDWSGLFRAAICVTGVAGWVVSALSLLVAAVCCSSPSVVSSAGATISRSRSASLQQAGVRWALRRSCPRRRSGPRCCGWSRAPPAPPPRHPS
jgi:hypothetical protein